MRIPAARRPPKRLLFDRRYGWVVDEWRDPSEEALAGGRGMFCILPIAKSLVNIASRTIDSLANSALRSLERGDPIFSSKPKLQNTPETSEADHMDVHPRDSTHLRSKADYMNEHLQKATVFDLTLK